MIGLPYNDVATFYDDDGLTIDGRPVLGDGHKVPAMFQQNTGYQHGNHQDGTVGAPQLVVSATDPYIAAQGQRLEGRTVSLDLFGAGPQYYRVTDVRPGRDVLLGNQLQHVECELKLVKVDNES